LNVVPLFVAPLRERREDIPLLVKHFAENYSRESNFPIKIFTRDVMQHFQEMPWKGNIRELRNVVERLVLMTPGNEIGIKEVEAIMPGAATPARASGEFNLSQLETLKDFKETAEKLFLMEKLKENDWNIAQTAKRIKTPRSNLYKKLEQYKIAIKK